MRRAAIIVAIFILAFWTSPAASAPTLPAEEAFNRDIEAELRARDPDSADAFAAASAAADRFDFDTAATLLAQVRAKDPWFVHATRRLCSVEARRKHRARAIELCREAIAADRSWRTEITLAFALIASDGEPPSDVDVQEALGLAQEASVSQKDTDPTTETVLCECALKAGDFATLAACSDRLKKVAPDDGATHYFAAIAEATAGHTDRAEAELDRAHAKGLPTDVYERAYAAVEASRSPLERWTALALRVTLGWLTGFGVLLGVGMLLSHATLHAASRVPVESSGRPRGFEAAVRRGYRVVLWTVCAYYYASLPLVALAVVAAGGGFIYACFAIGHIPAQLVWMVVLGVCASLWAMAKSVLVPARHQEPGEKLDLREHDRLRSVLREVAERIGTRPVDSVYLTPSTEIAVFERGGMLQVVSGKGERCLVLGAGVLEGMRVGELKAILAHEYGHFRNEDTAGGGFALAVRRSITTMALHLVRGRAASQFNPVWWFVRGFYLVFARISQGASRLQEVLADRWAAFAYGSETFGRGLRHVVDRTVRFDLHLRATLNEVVPKEEPVANIYTFVPMESVPAETIDEAVAQAMNRPPSPTDSHPPPEARIAWVSKIGAPAPPAAEGDGDDAWSLLSTREGIQRRMTETMRARLAVQGIRVQSATNAAAT